MLFNEKMKKIRSLFARLCKSKDGKTLVGNFGYLSLLQIAGYVFPLITMPYLARVIGANGYGKIAFAMAIILWVQTVSDWGFSYTATRDVAQNRGDNLRVSKIFTDVFWARCFLAAISFVALSLLIYIIPSFRENYDVILITYLIVPSQILFPDWFFQAVEKMRFITIFNLVLKVVFTVSIFIFVKASEDYILQPLLLAISYLLCGLMSFLLIIGKWKIHLGTPSINNVWIAIKNSSDVFLNNLMPNLYNSFSVLLLGNFGGPIASGIFDGGNKFATVFNQFQNVVSRTFFPFLSRKAGKHGLYAKLNIGASLIVALGLLVSAPLLVRIMLSEEFIDSVIVLRILSLSIIFLAVYSTYGTNYLIILHQESILRIATFWASLLGMIAAFPLVYYFSYIGAAISITLGRGLLGLFTWYCARKIQKSNG